MPGKAVALILAAGRATRFGSDKRRAGGPWSGPLLHHVLGLYRPLFDRLGVVTGPDDPFGEAACRLFSAHRIVNPEVEQGMGASLAKGAEWLITEQAGCCFPNCEFVRRARRQRGDRLASGALAGVRGPAILRDIDRPEDIQRRIQVSVSTTH